MFQKEGSGTTKNLQDPPRRIFRRRRMRDFGRLVEGLESEQRLDALNGLLKYRIKHLFSLSDTYDRHVLARGNWYAGL